MGGLPGRGEQVSGHMTARRLARRRETGALVGAGRGCGLRT
ncbi:hypothetical protein [Brachybacterium sacelli]